MNRKYCERWLKSCLKKKVSITATTIIMFLMTGLVVNTPIFASVLIGNTDGAPITPNGSVVSSWGITIGGGITNAGSHSVHVGDASLEEGERNVIIGTHATAGVNGGSRQFIRQSVAIGGGASANEGARAFGDQSIAIGANTIAEGNSSIAIGNDDVDRTNTITTKYTNLKGEETTGTIGDAYNALTGKSLMDGGQYRDTKSKEAAVAIGVKALAGNISLALGTASSADVVNGVAIGTGATVTRDNAIAIGGGATTEKEGTKEVDVTVNGIHYTWKGGENTIAGDVVSFGKEGYERQLKHVAAGKVSKDSTDAINGSQLHGVLEHITSEPVYFYAADNSSLDKITGTTAEAKNADALAKKIVARSMSNHRLNILGGATKDLSDNNIGVNYENDSTLSVKLAKELKDLKSTEFKNDTGDVATITGNGLTITPNGNAVSNKNVSVTKDGLNNGGNVIADVGGNLAGAKTGTTAPTTNATVPNNVDSIKNNAATVGDVLNAGWNLQNNEEARDFVKPYDTVNFVDGSGTTAVVDTAADRSTSKIKYNVNLGNGLEKDDANNKITVKADEKSLTVGADGVKAKTDNKTITTGDNGLKVVTGRIESANSGTMQVKEGDTGKIATVDSVVNAVNNAAFTLKASSTTGGTRNTNSTVEANGEAIKAGKTIEMIAGKNLDVKHDENGKITFATVENPSFSTVQVGGDQGPKFSKTSDGNIKVSGPNGADLVKITNVKDGDVNENSKDAINGSQFHKLANNTIKLAGKNGSDAATETDAQTLNQQNGIKFTVKSSDGKLLDVTAGGDTITITPKTGTITVGADGVPTATTTNGKLVTADQLVSALTEMGWKATADKDGTGTVTGTTSELIKAGETVTFKAGDNLKIKQDGKNFIYSLNTALSGLTSAEFKDDNKNKVNITPTGITITKPADTVNNQPEKTVTLNQDGLNNGGNLITNVASNLKNYNSGNKNGLVDLSNMTTTPNSNVATVGDLRNMGWVVSSDKTTGDLGTAYDDKVKNADEVKFVGTGAAVVSGKTENGVRTITVGVTVPSVEKGSINTATTGADEGKVVANKGDGDKFTTVDTVVNAINNAAWTATSAKTTLGELGATASNQLVKAGDTVTFEADKNIKITQDGSKFTFATKDNVAFETVQVGGDQGPKFSKTSDGDIKVSDKDGANPVKVTNVKDGDVNENSKDAINGSQFYGLAKNTIQLKGQNGTDAATETTAQDLDKTGGIKFTVKSSDGTLLDVTASGDTITLEPKTATITTDTDGVPTATTTNGKLVTADDLVTALKKMGWKATAGQEGSGTVTGNAEQLIKAGETVTFKAGDNLKIKQDGKNFIYSLNPELTNLSKVEVKDTAGNSVVTTPTGTTVTDKDRNTTKVDGNGITITPSGNTDSNKNVSVTKDGINAGEKAITNVASNLTNYDSGNKARLVDLSNTTTTPNSNVATVGDLRNMGWVVSSDKTTGNLGTAYNDQVRNANEVKFVGKGTATVSGKTVDGVRTITVEVNDQVSTNNSVTPVVYTKADGTKVYPKEVKNPDGTKEVKFYPNPDGTGTEIPKEEVITSVNGPDGTKNPTTLKNIAGNLEGAKTGTQAPTTNAAAPTNVDSIKNNAATVGDVLNAGWNLQNNGTEKDFVRPYDTVNFVDGLNTKAIVTTDKDGKVSNVQIDVKDLPIAYTNEAGDKVVKAADGKYYKESDLAGKVYDPTANTFKNADGTPLTTQPTEVAKDNIKTNLVNPNAAADKTSTTDPSILGNVKSGLDTIKEADNKAAAGLVNLNDKDDAGNYKVSDNNVATVGDLRNMGWVVSSDKTTGNLGTAYNDQVRNANEVKFVGKGTATVSGKTEGNVRTITVEVNDQVSTNNSVTPVVYTKADGTKVYPIKQADGTTKFFEKPDGTGTEILKGDVITSVNGPEGTTTPSTLSNVAGNLEGAKTGTQAPTTNATLPNTTDKTGNNYINPNNAATVGDVLNAGWNLQNNGTEKDFVRPYDTVNFVDGLNTKAIVTTDKDGKVSNVQIDVKDLPIAYTNEAGDKVVKAADGKYYKESDLAGKVYDPTANTFKNADGTPLTTQPTEVAKDNIKTNLVNPNAAADKTSTTDPSILGNVKSGLDTIKEADNKAAAGLVNLDTPNVSANNVATVGDLRNMGWVVSASDNAYTDTVKNANKVDFKGGNGIEVTGKTTPDGTREITVAIKEGAVTNNVKVTKEDGTVIEAIRDKDGKLYEKDANGKADKTKPVVLTAKDKVENNGSGFVTGNNVATAIQDSGWNLGKAKDVNKAFETEAKVHDKVNPNDDVNFVDGDNTTVSMVNVNAENTDGTSKTITYIKTDIKRDINIDSITIGRKNPEKSVTLTDKGLNNGGNNITNVAGNLDGAKTGTTAPTTNHAGVDTTTPTAANYVNPHNAATVGDVLNAGWNLKNNGTAKDFVKPYDTVNFVDGINTKVTVTTDPDGTKSDVRVDVVGLPIAFADKNGNRLVQGKDPVGNPVYYRMLSDGTVDKTLIIPASDVTVTNVNPVDSKINTVGTKGGAVISGIANGAKTYDAPTDKDGKDLKLGNDGKWYPADSVLINNKYYPAGSVVSKNGNVYPAGTTLDKDGNPTTSGTTPVTEVKSVVKPKNPGKAGLINFGHSNSDTTNAATVGDLQNMGWVVSTSDTGYNDQVRNANVVDFKEGEGIKISGETLENGVRQIKVGIDKNVVATKQELAQVERLSNAGIAGVAAMANIPQINEAASNRYNIAVGVGYHKGEKALAVGISGVSDGGRVVYKASAALDSQKQTTVGLGVGYQFGKRDIEPNELDRFRAQLDLVNTQKSSLAQRLKEETHKVVELNNKVEELEKQNKMLNEKMDLILKKLGGK